MREIEVVAWERLPSLVAKHVHDCANARELPTPLKYGGIR